MADSISYSNRFKKNEVTAGASVNARAVKKHPVACERLEIYQIENTRSIDCGIEHGMLAACPRYTHIHLYPPHIIPCEKRKSQLIETKQTFM